MLNRVQRELVTSHPLSPYRKTNSNVLHNFERSNSQLVMANGFAVANSQDNANRKIRQMLQEVIEKREIRERRESDQILGSYMYPTAFFNSQSKNYKQKYMVYNFLNRPKSFWAISYHVLVFVMVFACLIVTVLSTIKSYESRANNLLILLEKVIIIWFSSEFMLRLWSSSCKRQYQGWKGKFKYLIVPSRVIDLIVIIMSIVVIIISTIVGTRIGHEVFVASAFRGFHRFFQVLQILTLNKQLQPWKVLSSVIYDQREQLFMIFYIEFLVLCFLSYLAYIVEKDENELFDSIAEAMWWSLVTLSTVGYGDRVPVTWLGRLIGSIFIMFSVAIFALPAGIIGTGLAIKVQEEDRNQQRKNKKWAAAVLIQSAWRCYKANANYLAISAFFKHKPMDLFAYYDYENVAIKFIRLTKFFIAKQKFRELMRPLDIKYVIESYKYGQTDVNHKMKHIQQSIEALMKRFDLNECKMTETQYNVWTKMENIAILLNDIENRIEKVYIDKVGPQSPNVHDNDLNKYSSPQNDATLNDNKLRRQSF